MKIKVLMAFLLAVVCSASANAKGILPVIYSNGEEVVKVKDLPHTDEYTIQTPSGAWCHADLGIMHEQFSLFWIPLVNYGTEKYVLFTDQDAGDYDYIYADLSSSDIEYLQSEIGGIPAEPELPFWDAWGGKLLVLAVVALLFWFGRSSSSKEEEEEESEQPKEPTMA